MTFANHKIVGHTVVKCKKPIGDDGGLGSGAGVGDSGAFDTGDSMANPGVGGQENWGAPGVANLGEDDWGTAPAVAAW